jgi:hypothetical protein
MGLALLPALCGAAETNWLDVESRIQYGYYTEDPRSLASVMELLAPADSENATRSYYAGLANYRLTQLALTKDKSRAKETAEACVHSLDQALKIQREFAEALALQSACLDVLSTLEAWRTPFAASRSERVQKGRSGLRSRAAGNRARPRLGSCRGLYVFGTMLSGSRRSFGSARRTGTCTADRA